MATPGVTPPPPGYYGAPPPPFGAPPPAGGPPGGWGNNNYINTGYSTGNPSLDNINNITTNALSQAYAPWPPPAAPAPGAPPTGVPPMPGPTPPGATPAPGAMTFKEWPKDAVKNESGMTMDDINTALKRAPGTPVTSADIQNLNNGMNMTPPMYNMDAFKGDKALAKKDLAALTTYASTGGIKSTSSITDITSKDKGGTGLTADDICLLQDKDPTKCPPPGTPVTKDMVQKAYDNIKKDKSILDKTSVKGAEPDKVGEDLNKVSKQKLDGPDNLSNLGNSYKDNKAVMQEFQKDDFKDVLDEMSGKDKSGTKGNEVRVMKYDAVKKVADMKPGDKTPEGKEVTADMINAAQAMTKGGDPNKDGGKNALAKKLFGDDDKAYMDSNHISIGSLKRRSEIDGLADDGDVNSWKSGINTGGKDA